MAAESASTRTGIITGAIVAALTIGAFLVAYPKVPRGILVYTIVIAIALPLWAAVRAIDQAVFASARLERLPKSARVAIVAVTGALIAAIAIGVGWLLVPVGLET